MNKLANEDNLPYDPNLEKRVLWELYEDTIGSLREDYPVTRNILQNDHNRRYFLKWRPMLLYNLTGNAQSHIPLLKIFIEHGFKIWWAGDSALNRVVGNVMRNLVLTERKSLDSEEKLLEFLDFFDLCVSKLEDRQISYNFFHVIAEKPKWAVQIRDYLWKKFLGRHPELKSWLNEVNHDGYTPLGIAVRHGDEGLARDFVLNGANPCVRQGWNAESFYRFFLSKGIDGFQFALWSANHLPHYSLFSKSQNVPDGDYLRFKFHEHVFRITLDPIPWIDNFRNLDAFDYLGSEDELWKIRSPILQSQHFPESISWGWTEDKFASFLQFSGSPLRRYVLFRRLIATRVDQTVLMSLDVDCQLDLVEHCMLNYVHHIIVRDKSPYAQEKDGEEDMAKLDPLPEDVREALKFHLSDVILRHSLLFWNQKRYGWGPILGADHA